MKGSLIVRNLTHNLSLRKRCTNHLTTGPFCGCSWMTPTTGRKLHTVPNFLCAAFWKIHIIFLSSGAILELVQQMCLRPPHVQPGSSQVWLECLAVIALFVKSRVGWWSAAEVNYTLGVPNKFWRSSLTMCMYVLGVHACVHACVCVCVCVCVCTRACTNVNPRLFRRSIWKHLKLLSIEYRAIWGQHGTTWPI